MPFVLLVLVLYKLIIMNQMNECIGPARLRWTRLFPRRGVETLHSVTGTTQERVTQDLAGGGGSSWAWTTLWKVERLCEPSQKGLRSEKPQRQRPILVRPPRP